MGDQDGGLFCFPDDRGNVIAHGEPGLVIQGREGPVSYTHLMLTIACYKVGAVAHPIAMSYEEKELARSLNVTESRCYFGPTYFYKTDYEERILAVRDQTPLLKDIVLIDSCLLYTSRCV